MSEALITGASATPAVATSIATSTVASTHPSNADSVVSMLGSMALVVALIFALAWLARKLQGMRAVRGDLLQVTGGVSVGGKERVVIVKVGGDHFLVGVAQGQVSLLHRFVSAPGAVYAGEDASNTEHAVVIPFADRLRELLRARKAA